MYAPRAPMPSNGEILKELAGGDFDAEGYAFDAARSEPQRYVFRRRVED